MSAREWAPRTRCTSPPRRSAWPCRAAPRRSPTARACGRPWTGAGRRIVELIAEDVRPRSILTAGAFRNAVTAVLAVSGSVNTLKHLQAVAVEAGCDVDVYALFEELAPQVPLLSAVKPNGDRRIDEFEAAGGALGLLRQLRPMLDASQPTVAGLTPGRGDRHGHNGGLQDVIRPLDDPLARHPGIVILRGSLAPDGAVLKRTVADDGPHRFLGPAKVFRSREEGLAAIRAGEGAARPGRGADRAGPARVAGDGLHVRVRVRAGRGRPGGPGGCDHRRADVRPGQQGDLGRLPLLPPPAGCGWLSVYARSVRPLGEGATLGGL